MPDTRLTPLLLAALLAGCAATKQESVEEARHESSPAIIAGQLADAAEMRDDPNHMRVLVHFRRPAEPTLAVVAPELEREVVTALSGRFHLFDARLAESLEPSTWQANLDDRIAKLDVTHALICDTDLRDGDIVLSMRLVEHQTLHIVATAQGSFPLDALSDANRVALANQHKSSLFIAPPPEQAAKASFDHVARPDVVQLASTGRVGPKWSYKDYDNVRTIPMKYVPPKTGLVDEPPADESTEESAGASGTTDQEPPTGEPARPLSPRPSANIAPTTIPAYRGPASRRLNSTGRELKKPKK